MGGERWKLRPTVFGVALVCFFLPFMTVSCRGQGVATATGLQLVTGFTIEDGGSSGRGQSTQRQGSEPLAVLAFLAVLGGLGLSFLRSRAGAIGAAIAGAVCAFALFRLRAKIDAQLLEEGAGLFRVEYHIPFYLTLLLCFAAVGFNIYLLRTADESLGESPLDGMRRAPSRPPGG